MTKLLTRYQNKLRAGLNAAAVAKRADVFVQLTTKDLPPVVAERPDEAARMAEDVRLEFGISEKDLDEAFERAGIPVAPLDQAVGEMLRRGEPLQ